MSKIKSSQKILWKQLVIRHHNIKSTKFHELFLTTKCQKIIMNKYVLPILVSQRLERIKGCSLESKLWSSPGWVFWTSPSCWAAKFLAEEDVEVDKSVKSLSNLDIVFFVTNQMILFTLVPRVNKGSKITGIQPFLYGTSSLYSVENLPQIEVWKGNAGSFDITVSATAGHTVKPSHIDSMTTYEYQWFWD